MRLEIPPDSSRAQPGAVVQQPMEMPAEAVAPSPHRVITALAGFQLSAALKAAIELDVFTAIGAGQRTADALAMHCKADLRGVRILADYLVINGFLSKQGPAYELTAESRRYLDRRSADFVGEPVAFVQDPFVWSQFNRLTESVRAGGAAADALKPNHQMWVTFARVMGKQMAAEAQNVPPVIQRLLPRRTPRPLKILDVAAGHGMFGIAFARADPTCQVVAQDWPQILEVARENARAEGVLERFTMVPGDILQADIGTGYDVVLIPNLIHHLDRPTSVKILKKVRAAMNARGLVAIVEFAPNEDRLSPGFAAFALFVLALTPGGDAYTVQEVLSMCAEAGFKEPSAFELSMERLLVARNLESTLNVEVSDVQFSGRILNPA